MFKSNFLRIIKKVLNKESNIGRDIFLFRITILSILTVIWLFFIIVESDRYPNFSLYPYAVLVSIWVIVSFVQVVKRGRHVSNSFAINAGVVQFILNCIPISTVISMWSWILFKIDYLTPNISLYMLYFLIQSIFFVILGIIPWKDGTFVSLDVSKNDTKSSSKPLLYLMLTISSVISWVLIAIYIM